MRRCGVTLTTVLAMLINLFGMGLAPPLVTAAPASARPGIEIDASHRELSPALADRPALNEAEESARTSFSHFLPTWFTAANQPTDRSALPVWFVPTNHQPASENRKSVPSILVPSRLASPPKKPLLRDIPLSLLSVFIIGPDVASLGSPPGDGETYTAVIRNNSSQIAYGIYLTATHPSFFVYDGDQVLTSSSTGAIALSTDSSSPTAITWTPNATHNLVPGEVITLSFKLRATCDAQSGQQMRIGVRYNADPPPAGPVELNTGGLNITTGRGNLVIKKEPALQNLGTPDFGQPITWVVTVQNTGLGKLYNATITDTGGINLSPPGGDLTPAVTIPMLDINEVQTYTVVGTVEACNFTNVALGSWPCGNLVGDATVITPLQSTASVLFNPQAPNVSIQVSSPITCPYCDPVTRTVAITINSIGGPAASFRIDSTFESDSFWTVVPSSVSSGWLYTTSTGLFGYNSGTPTGTLPGAGAGGPTVLTFDVFPQLTTICSDGSGDVAFLPLYKDICSSDPFTGSPVSSVYQYGQSEAPVLDVAKDGPSVVAGGEVFTYQITISGQNPDNISGTIDIADLIPPEFEVVGPITPSAGITNTTGQSVTWSIDPTGLSDPFTETLTYAVRAITETGGVCGASQIAQNNVQAVAEPKCPGCPPITTTAYVETAIENNEGIFPDNSHSGSYEACGSGFTIVNSYLITGSAVITWDGAVFTEALGTAIGGGALPGPGLIYRPGTLVVTVNGVDYTASLTPVTTTGQLVIDLSPLHLTAPTQNVTLLITYTIEIPETALTGEVEQTFYDWTQLFLPGVSDNQACAANDSFNQALRLTIGRGDLSVELNPRILDRCSTNPLVITVNDETPGRLTDHVVVTFTSSIAEIASAWRHGFSYAGSLAGISPITVTSGTIGGGLGIITFTLPADADIDGDGEIRSAIDINCTDKSDWNAGVTFQSLCDFPHGHTTTRDHIYNVPNLLLFATPLRYTVREKEVLWKFFVTNNGNLTATNVVVDNEIVGLSVVTYTSDSDAGISVGVTLPATDTIVPFTIDELGPNEQREITLTARVVACDPLYVTITGRLECFGTLCSQPQAVVNFDTPDPYLLTNNGETADLPMCDVGEVIFTTKNASADVTLYQLNITETLIGLVPVPGAPMTMTIVDSSGNEVVSTTGFMPVTGTVMTPWGSGIEYAWRAISATADVYTWFNALPPLYVVQIRVPVRTSCVPPNQPRSFAAADALGPCGKHLGYVEDAVTLRTLQPDMSVLKEGKGVTGDYGENVYASPGQTVTWRIVIENRPTDRSYVAENVVLSDTWPFNFDFITATASNPAFTHTLFSAQNTIVWNIGNIEVGGYYTFTITGTVAISSDACHVGTVNQTILTFGCDDGCTSSIVPQDTANLITEPILDTSVSPNAVSVCGENITVTIRNDGSSAYSTTLAVTLPPGYVYSETIGIGVPNPTFTDTSSISTTTWVWTPITIPGRSGSSPYFLDMVFRIQNTATAGVCSALDSIPVTVTISYNDHPTCFDTITTTRQGVQVLDLLFPNLILVKLPRTQTVDAGERITWTIIVTNTGDGIAENVVVTDVVGTNYDNIAASAGSDGASPHVSGHTITWTLVGPIPVSGVWTATVMADVLSTGSNRNVVTATAYCATGCDSASANDTAYTTLLQDFSKNPEIQTGTIGSLVVFTFTTFLPDQNAVYEQLTITDVLPVGLGYVASVLTYTYDGDTPPGVTLVDTTPSVPAGIYPSGPVVWTLGDLSGTVQIDGVITAVIQNVGSNSDGVRLLNELQMTYTDDGQPYVYTDTANVDILEPILHIGKSYVTPSGCEATLFQDNFNVPNTTNATVGNWTRVSASTEVRDGTLHLYNSGDVVNSTVLSDFSLSFMARKNSNADFWVVLRMTGDWDDDSYRLEWRTSDFRLQRFSNTFGDQVLATAGGAPGPGEWHHFEIRAEGPLLRLYVDGQSVLSAIDEVNISGSTQFRTLTGSDTYVDDILVTRLEQTACTVGANDLVTYTLVVSNQGHLPGYDLVITDALPGGMSLVTYTMDSDDPASMVTAEPAPIPGATGALAWGINQLTPTIPFNPLNHTALTLTVVLRVSASITANIVLDNQAFLAYDNWPGDTNPTTIMRQYSGGSHSTAVRTVNGGLVKTVTFSPPPTATLGSLVTYALIIPAPPISATLYNVVVTDTVNPSMTVVSAVTGGGTGGTADFAGQVVTATFDSVPAYTQAYVTITARISDGLGAYAGLVITNSAVMIHATATEITGTNEVSTTVGEPSLTLGKFSVPPTSSTVGPGDVVTYTVLVTNWNGPFASPAYDIFITDTLSAYVTLFPPIPFTLDIDGVPLSAPADYTLNYAGDVLAIDVADTISIPVGGVLELVYRGRVDADVPARIDLTNHVSATWSSLPGPVPGDRDYGPVTDTTAIHTGSPLLTLTKSIASTPVVAGGLLTYTLSVVNGGAASASGVVITDIVPTNTDYWSCGPLPCGEASRIVSWTLGILEVGVPRVVTMVVTVTSPLPDGTIITNTAWVTSTEGLTDTATVTTPVQSDHVLTLTKTGMPRPVQAGGLLTYSLAWAVGGTERALDVTISDTVPMSTTYQGCEPGPCGEVGGVVRWSLGDRDPGESGVVTMTVMVASPLVSGTVLYNAAVITDRQGVTDTAEVTDTVVASHTLTVRKSAQPATITPAGLLTYTIVYTVAGNEPVYGVTISDTTPLHTTFYAAAPPPDRDPGIDNAGVVVWSVGDFLPPASGIMQASGAVTLVVRTDTPLIGGLDIVNTTLITDTSNVTDTGRVTVPVVSSHVLTLTKTGMPRPVQAGGLLTYSLAWAVGGTERALDVTISDTVPMSTTYQACEPGPCGEVGGVVRWSLGDRDPGESGVVTMTVMVASPLVSGTVLYNAAVITDRQGVTDTAEVTVPVESSHSLVITKTATPNPVHVGDILTYTMLWTVDGNEPAENVIITDAVPVNVTYQNCSGGLFCSESSGVVTWSLGKVSPVARGAVTMVVRVNDSLPAGTVITNMAWITDSQGITDTAMVTTVTPLMSELRLVKASVDVDGGVLQPGDRITYRLRLSNVGTLTATNVVVSDTVPPDTTYVPGSIAGGDSQDDSNLPELRWRLNLLPLNTPVTFTFAVTVNVPLTDGVSIRNRAFVTSTEGVTDTAEVTDTVVASHTLTVRKSAQPATVTPAGLLTYTIVYTVAGNEPVYGVTISDTTPLHTTFYAAAPPPDRDPGIDNAGVVVWSVGDFLPPASGIMQASGAVTLVVRTDTPLMRGLDIVNTTLITDTSGVTETSTMTTPVLGSHTLALTKTVHPPSVSASGKLTYTLIWSVSGDEMAPDATISDTVPANTTFITATTPVIVNGNLLIWSLGDRYPGESGFVTFTVRVDSLVASGTVIYNAAVITDSQGIIDTGTVTAPVESPAVEVNKRLASDPDWDNNIMTFTIVITNVGPSTLDVVPLMDDHDHRLLTFKTATPMPEEVITDTGSIFWHDLTGPPPYGFDHNLPPGQSFAVTTIFTIVGDITRTTNTAVVTGVVDVYGNPGGRVEDEEEIINIPTGLELLYLRASGQKSGVLVEWATLHELSSYGFWLYRATLDQFAQAHQLAFQPSQGGIHGAEYNYLDKQAKPEEWYWYWLVGVNNDGNRSRYGPVSATAGIQNAWRYRVYLPVVVRGE